jgi:hypothetical protein
MKKYDDEHMCMDVGHNTIIIDNGVSPVERKIDHFAIFAIVCGH